MPLTVDEVRRIAQLSRLRLEPAEEESLVAQLGEVVDYIDQLAQHSAAEEIPAPAGGGVEAEDREREGLPRERFLDNAPEASDGFLVVPKVKGDAGE